MSHASWTFLEYCNVNIPLLKDRTHAPSLTVPKNFSAQKRSFCERTEIQGLRTSVSIERKSRNFFSLHLKRVGLDEISCLRVSCTEKCEKTLTRYSLSILINTWLQRRRECLFPWAASVRGWANKQSLLSSKHFIVLLSSVVKEIFC